MRYLITGATGFVGGHIAEACTQRGHDVRVIARQSSDTSLVEKIGAAILRGDLRDPKTVRLALEDVDIVVHCAGKLGEWGPVDDYRAVNVECLRTLLEAAKGQALTRFVYMSSLGVYAARHHFGTDETEPLPKRHRDGYSQSKMEAEQLALRYYHDFGVPVVALRPGFIYGPRDHVVVPGLLRSLRAGSVRYPGARGARALNTIFIRNLIDAVFLAADREEAVGQVYNLTDGEFVSKRRFIEAVADAVGLPRPMRTPPYWLAWLVTWCCEKLARLRGAREAPAFNFTRWKFIALNLDFSIEKAKLDLGYLPRVRFEDAIYETMAWFQSQGRNTPCALV
jgi:nucleoside-diphosphate-sugar epimerase